jgi:NAD(P)H-hydrate epimerase
MINKIVTAAEMKTLDARTIHTMGVPSMVLMERAALATVDALFENAFDLSQVLCVCGVGNNGGDGFAVARMLHIKGVNAKVLLVGDTAKLSPETKQQMAIARNYGVKMFENDFAVLDQSHTTIVDALFGIGGSRPLVGRYTEVVEKINSNPAEVLAVDIPSGISADTGEVLGTAVHAKVTVTFAYNKNGLTTPPGSDYAGEVIIMDIGIYDDVSVKIVSS